MAGRADEWVSALMLMVAVCEQVETAAADSGSPAAAALTNSALALRELATSELDRVLSSR